MKTTLIVVLVLAVLGLGGWMVYDQITGTEAPQGKKAADAPTNSYTWTLAEAGEDAGSGAPKTTVTLNANGDMYEIGTYTGSCTTIEGSAWSLQEGEVSGVICWWAGGGNEIGVFNEGGAYVVKHGDLDEGSAETPGFRGNFKTLIDLKV